MGHCSQPLLPSCLLAGVWHPVAHYDGKAVSCQAVHSRHFHNETSAPCTQMANHLTDSATGALTKTQVLRRSLHQLQVWCDYLIGYLVYESLIIYMFIISDAEKKAYVICKLTKCNVTIVDSCMQSQHSTKQLLLLLRVHSIIDTNKNCSLPPNTCNDCYHQNGKAISANGLTQLCGLPK